jgi:hypothetical protein
MVEGSADSFEFVCLDSFPDWHLSKIFQHHYLWTIIEHYRFNLTGCQASGELKSDLLFRTQRRIRVFVPSAIGKDWQSPIPWTSYSWNQSSAPLNEQADRRGNSEGSQELSCSLGAGLSSLASRAHRGVAQVLRLHYWQMQAASLSAIQNKLKAGQLGGSGRGLFTWLRQTQHSGSASLRVESTRSTVCLPSLAGNNCERTVAFTRSGWWHSLEFSGVSFPDFMRIGALTD